jgi:HK97 gp10 family phage protein
MADKTIAVSGLSELDKKLEALPGKIQRRALRKALLAGADIIRDEARATVRRKSGKLAAAIESSASLSIASADDREFLNAAGVSASDAAIAIVSVRGGPARRAHLTEFGAAPHEERPKKKKVLADPATGEIFGRVVKHPGSKAYPFMRPAFDTHAEDALNAIVEVLRDEVEKAAKEPA